jgi:hypothetical protein
MCLYSLLHHSAATEDSANSCQSFGISGVGGRQSYQDFLLCHSPLTCLAPKYSESSLFVDKAVPLSLHPPCVLTGVFQFPLLNSRAGEEAGCGQSKIWSFQNQDLLWLVLHGYFLGKTEDSVP